VEVIDNAGLDVDAISLLREVHFRLLSVWRQARRHLRDKRLGNQRMEAWRQWVSFVIILLLVNHMLRRFAKLHTGWERVDGGKTNWREKSVCATGKCAL
jgi:hypothetical protein